MLRIVTRGDDVGVAACSGAAAAEAARDGLLRNVSLLACGPGLLPALEALRPLEGSVCLGLHACVTCEFDSPRWGPLADGPGAALLREPDGGMPRSPKELLQRGASLEAIVREVRAQLALLRSHGVRLSYMDTRMGFDRLPGVRDALAALAESEGLLLVPPLPSLVKEARGGSDWGGAAAEAVLHAGDGDFLLLGHPLLIDGETRRLAHPDAPPGGVAFDRDRQRAMFTDVRVREAFARRRAAAARYDEL